jgi:hypothetical protein
LVARQQFDRRGFSQHENISEDDDGDKAEERKRMIHR